MKTYLATRNILHNGRLVEAGKTIALDDAAAAPLLASGAIEAVALKAKAAEDTK